MRYHIWTVGCQMNVADSDRMASALAAMGGVLARAVVDADVVVLNTCSVRQTAEDRALGKLSGLRALKRRRPDLIVVLAGCMVGDDSLPDLQRRLPFVDAFIRPADIEALRETVRALAPGGLSFSRRASVLAQASASTVPNVAHEDSDDFESPASPASPIGWVPVIYGCNRSCSYCIVPARRGAERSRPIAEIEREVREMVAQGVREVRLLGQIVDRYGWDLPAKSDLADLFLHLAAIDGLYRIRFLTSHPRDLRDRVIEAVASLPKVCPDFNLPIQAGDDTILRSMRRGYTVAAYRRLVDRLRARIPDVALSTDVIVGYPSESDGQFQRTLNLLADLCFDVVHVAMYSRRPGTLAAEMPDDVAPEAKRERLQMVEELQTRVASERNATLLGQDLEILVEGQSKSKWEGRTRTNKPVFFSSEDEWLGKLAVVKIARAGPWSLSGSLSAIDRPSTASS